MVEKREIFRPYTDLEGERRREVEKIIQQLRWVEGFDSYRAWSFVIELGAWVLQQQKTDEKCQELCMDFKITRCKV